ncbi:MAG: DMT family transporter [Ilumatobacteraceae bacterium]
MPTRWSRALDPRSAVAAAACLFGTASVATRLQASTTDPMVLAGWRVAVGGCALVALSWVAGCPPWRRRAPVASVALGAISVVGFQVAFFTAVDRLGVTQATVLTIGTGPIAAGVMDHVRGRASLTRRWLGGVGSAIVGVALVAGGSWHPIWFGWLSAITAGTAFPVYAGVIRDLSSERSHLTAVATVFGGAAPLAAIVAVQAREPMPTGGELVALAYVGLVATALAYALWSSALRTIPVRDTVAITMLEPVTAAILAAAFLGETLRVAAVVGMLAVVGGVVVASTEASPSTARTFGPRRMRRREVR